MLVLACGLQNLANYCAARIYIHSKLYLVMVYNLLQICCRQIVQTS